MTDEEAAHLFPAAWAAGFRAGRDAAIARAESVVSIRETRLGGRRAGMVTTAIRNVAVMLREVEPPAAVLPDLRVLEVRPEWRSGRGRWWQDDGAGYTDKIERIGLYRPDDHRVLEYQGDDPDARSVVRTLADVIGEQAACCCAQAAAELLRRAWSR